MAAAPQMPPGAKPRRQRRIAGDDQGQPARPA